MSEAYLGAGKRLSPRSGFHYPERKEQHHRLEVCSECWILRDPYPFIITRHDPCGKAIRGHLQRSISHLHPTTSIVVGKSTKSDDGTSSIHVHQREQYAYIRSQIRLARALLVAVHCQNPEPKEQNSAWTCTGPITP